MTDPRFIPASERLPNHCFNGGEVGRRIEALKQHGVWADERIAELEAELVDYKAGLSATEGFLANSKAREQSVMSELVGARSLVDELAEFLDRQELVIVDGEYAAEIGVEFDALLAKVEAYKAGKDE